MELTWVAAGSALLVGAGYVSFRRANDLRPVCWTVLCISLFALATRDLFRPSRNGRPTSETDDQASERPNDQATDEGRPPPFARLGSRIVDWFG